MLSMDFSPATNVRVMVTGTSGPAGFSSRVTATRLPASGAEVEKYHPSGASMKSWGEVPAGARDQGRKAFRVRRAGLERADRQFAGRPDRPACVATFVRKTVSISAWLDGGVPRSPVSSARAGIQMSLQMPYSTLNAIWTGFGGILRLDKERQQDSPEIHVGHAGRILSSGEEQASERPPPSRFATPTNRTGAAIRFRPGCARCLNPESSAISMPASPCSARPPRPRPAGHGNGVPCAHPGES